jgi:hypothetical protein
MLATKTSEQLLRETHDHEEREAQIAIGKRQQSEKDEHARAERAESAAKQGRDARTLAKRLLA